MLSLPVVELGYGLGPVTLNTRHYTASYLVERGCPASRVPDIELVGLPLGFNYDGRLHLDLASIAKADGPHVETAVRQVREKYLDDLRRNRELTAMGVVTLPVTSEDLFREGGCDALVFEARSVPWGSRRLTGRGARWRRAWYPVAARNCSGRCFRGPRPRSGLASCSIARRPPLQRPASRRGSSRGSGGGGGGPGGCGARTE